MDTLEKQVESVLLFKNEPVSLKELSSTLGKKNDEIKAALDSLQRFYAGRGIVIVTDGENYGFGTSPENSAVIEAIQKDEFSRELGRAGLETLAVVLYKGPISRREIDQIRGVNSGFILRALLIRGLIEKTDSIAGERSFTYKPTLKLFEHLGVANREALPQYDEAVKKMVEFVDAADKNDTDQDA
jgi:segregation and condensation protein B